VLDKNMLRTNKLLCKMQLTVINNSRYFTFDWNSSKIMVHR